MSTPGTNDANTPTPPSIPPFDAEKPHHAKPKLRPVRGFPAQMGEQQVLGLADARQISSKVVFTMPAAQIILPLLDGNRSVDEVTAQVGRGLTRPVLEQLIAQLDDAGLLFGPTFDAMLESMRKEFDSSPVLPPASTAAFADVLVNQEFGEETTDEQRNEHGARKLREIMDQWMAKALESVPNPSFDELPRAVVAPHIDYGRGWVNYANVWGRLRVTDRPDRVLILGTNHFGLSTGIAACDKGYQSPLGTCPVDEQVVGHLRKRLGDKVFENRYDHEREHSIELQIPWIQHCLGTDEAGNYCKVVGVLIHDPTVNNGESYDGNGVALEPFIEAMREILAEIPGKTLVVSSADLSHVGPAFGDQQKLGGDESEAAAFRNRVFQHDREMLELVRQNKPQDLVAAMAWQQNPTRWCSTGNIVATLQIVNPSKVDVLHYAAAMDPQGLGMVSSAALSMV
jgi:AmmeMemoRadiSam system protein B